MNYREYSFFAIKFDFTESLSRSYQYPDSYGGIRLTWDLFPASVSKTKKGHLSYHHYLLSKDGNTIISFNNKKIQDFESLKEEAQELETEVEKVYNFINKEQFSKVTIQELLNALRQVQKRIKNNRLQMLRHQEIPGVVQNLLLRQKYATEIYQSISKAELDNLALVLEQEIVKKRKEIEAQKTFENTPEGRMKKLAESLSLTDIIILKKYLIKKGP